MLKSLIDSFLAILKDAANRFPASMTSSALSLRPASSAATPAPIQLGQLGQLGNGVNLQIGNLQISSKNAGAQVEAGLNDAANVARGIFQVNFSF